MSWEVSDMDCSQFEEFVHDLDRPGTEGFAVRETALAHAESCSRCGQLLTQAESLDLALRTLGAEHTDRQAPPRVETRLVEEFLRHKAEVSRRGVRWQIAALATAAAMLLALGFSLRRYLAPAPSPTVAPPNASLSSGGSANVAGPSAVDSSQNSADQQTTVAENQTPDPESETAFVPLPYADGSVSSDGGAIVRVVLSRQALASLGVPVTDMGATDRIPADIVVSEDGAPQAIRLVSQAQLDD